MKTAMLSNNCNIDVLNDNENPSGAAERKE